jgi:hypothetical protein
VVPEVEGVAEEIAALALDSRVFAVSVEVDLISSLRFLAAAEE